MNGFASIDRVFKLLQMQSMLFGVLCLERKYIKDVEGKTLVACKRQYFNRVS